MESLREELLENILKNIFLALDVFLRPNVAVLNLCTLRINSVHISEPLGPNFRWVVAQYFPEHCVRAFEA